MTSFSADAGTVINVFLAILIGSFSLALLAPEMQGPSSFSCFFIIKNTDFDTPQQSLMPVVLPRSCMTLLIVFLQLILPIREVSSLKRSKVKSVSRTSSSTIHLVPMFPLSRTSVSSSLLAKRLHLLAHPVPENRLSSPLLNASMIRYLASFVLMVLTYASSTFAGCAVRSDWYLRNQHCSQPRSAEI